MISVVASVVAAGLLGVAAGRFAGRRGWLVVPVLPVIGAVVSVVDVGYVDPLFIAVATFFGMVTALGVLLGLALRRRAARAAET